MNIVAQKSLVTMALRLSCGCNCDEVLCEVYWHLPVSALIKSITKENASLTDPEYFLVRSACDSIGEMYGVSSQPVVQQQAASDTQALRKAGFRAIDYWLGKLCGMHGLNEWVRIDQLHLADPYVLAVVWVLIVEEG